jgi:histidinol dehydrogenase
VVKRINASSPDAAANFAALLDARLDAQGDVSGVVKEIVTQVRAHGDAALCDYTQQFDRLSLTPETMRMSADDMAKAQAECAPNVRAALELAAERIREYHAKQLPEDVFYTDKTGTQLGWQWRPLDAVGLYVPGGRASYPSSVLMNAIPAKVAGAKRLAMVVPTPDGIVNPALLVAAELAGVDEIYCIGGAQAVAALAYGTESIAAVDKIVGPGNAYVAEAKRQVFGRVGIDTIAGPSEICVVADAQNNPDWIAADLLSQAEHDPQAQSILVCDDAAFAARVEASIEATLQTLAREAIARESWQEQGVVLMVPDVHDCVDWINLIAPEHLELAIDAPEKLAAQVNHAGAIFLGRYTPEAIGDYIAGPSHVLPTTRAARFSSGLSVYDFIKKSSLIGCTQKSLHAIASQADALAASEGLGAHGLSVRLRVQD